MGHGAAGALDFGDDIADNLAMQAAQCAIDLDETVVAVSGITDQTVGARQTAKPQAVGGARWNLGVSLMIIAESAPRCAYRSRSRSSISASERRRPLPRATIAWAASKSSSSTIAGKAPSARIHMSGV